MYLYLRGGGVAICFTDFCQQNCDIKKAFDTSKKNICSLFCDALSKGSRKNKNVSVRAIKRAGGGGGCRGSAVKEKLFFKTVKVLLHTFIDAMRTEGDREINHHGKAVKIGPDGQPIHEEDDESDDSQILVGM